MTTAYIALFAAIVLEVLGTSMMPLTQQFTRLVPTAVLALCYLTAFYLLTIAIKFIPLGLAYAIWSATGVVLVAAVGWIVFKQTLDMPAIIGLTMIVAGVLVVNLFSKSIGH
ncbi:SMR family transporter [Paracoccaceae bacterium GXU_MW_L88]